MNMVDDAELAEAEDEPKEEEVEEQPKKEEKRVVLEKTKTPRARNIVGMIFNLRMLRRIVQIFFFIGINAWILGAIGNEAAQQLWIAIRDIIPTLPMIAPLEGVYSMIGGSFDAMHRELTAGIFPFFTLGSMIIILTILGRTTCGWVCPIGTIQDFATLPNRAKIRPAPSTEGEMRKVKAGIFIIVTFFSSWVAVSTALGTDDLIRRALGVFADSGFAPINPAYIIFKLFFEVPWPNSLDTLWYLSGWGWIFWLQFIFVILIVVVSFWFPRWYCRWLCPAGWFYGIFSRNALVSIGRNPAKCTPDTCNVCEVVCPMNIRIRRFPYQHVHSPECIMCLECKSHCPNGAIEIKFS